MGWGGKGRCGGRKGDSTTGNKQFCKIVNEGVCMEYIVRLKIFVLNSSVCDVSLIS